MIATVVPGHWPVVREMGGDRVLETLSPGAQVVVVHQDGERLVVITEHRMGHVAAEFMEWEAGDLTELEAKVTELEELVRR